MSYSNYPQRNSGHSDSLEVGLEFQDFVCIELAKQNIFIQNINSKKFQRDIGENLQGFEIKLDRGVFKNNRLSIEIAEKTDGSNKLWVPSGIYRNDNSRIYIQGNYELFYLFKKSTLIEVHKTGNYKAYEFPYDKPTIRKFYLPFQVCDQYADKKCDFRVIDSKATKNMAIQIDLEVLHKYKQPDLF